MRTQLPTPPTQSEPRDEGLRCPGCGYNLTGLEGDACPECGAAFDARELRDRLRAGIGPIPIWDEREKRGWLRAYLATAAMLLFRPGRYVAMMPIQLARRSARQFYTLSLYTASALAASAAVSRMAAPAEAMWYAYFGLTWIVGAMIATAFTGQLIVPESRPYGTGPIIDQGIALSYLQSVFIPLAMAGLLTIALSSGNPAWQGPALLGFLGIGAGWVLHTAVIACALTRSYASAIIVIVVLPMIAGVAGACAATLWMLLEIFFKLMRNLFE